MHPRTPFPSALHGMVALLASAMLLGAAGAGGPANADAEKLLKSAQEAYGQKDFPLATSRFREVLTRYATTPSEPEAAFGLAVCLIEGHDKNNGEALKLLESLRPGVKGIDDLQVVYYRGAALRGMGASEMLQATLKPKEA